MSLVMSRFTRGGIHGDNTDTIKKKNHDTADSQRTFQHTAITCSTAPRLALLSVILDGSNSMRGESGGADKS
jgi:hypothetical protein